MVFNRNHSYIMSESEEMSEQSLSPISVNKKPVVYCLSTVSEPIQTYIGATLNPERRLRQHNGILVGGAKATGRRPGDWYRVCRVTQFASFRTALSFEWHWKHFSKKLKGDPLTRRQMGLDLCLDWAKKKGMEGLEVVYD
jgi:predicted GIY-YIG superfamily endonuclease